MSVRTPLNNVPEHGPFTPTSPSMDIELNPGPYFSPQAAGSSTTLGPHSISGRAGSTSTVDYSNTSSPSSPTIIVNSLPAGAAEGGGTPGGSGSGSSRTRSTRKPSGSRTPSSQSGNKESSSSRRTPSVSSNTSLLSVPTLSSRSSKSASTPSTAVIITSAGMTVGGSNISSRFRVTPKLPHSEEPSAPPTLMHWSKAPVWGLCPTRTMRGHTATLVNEIAWVFGGCDDKDTAKDMYCFDVETNQWSYPKTVGELPNPSRAHSATLIDRSRILFFGGGQGAHYSDTIHILDTSTRKWSRPIIEDGPDSERPTARRAHTAVYYHGQVWIFGGGNGVTALNDVWVLDGGGGGGGDKDSATAGGTMKMEWRKIQTSGARGRDGNPIVPSPRGYHTANLVGHMMIVVGGSDGKDCFSEVWCLNLDTLYWTLIDLPQSHRRLAHTATQVGSYLFIQGGHDGAAYVSDMKLFNLITLQYETRPILGKTPIARGYHVSLLHDSRIFYFGGYDGLAAYDDVYIVDLAAAAYLPQVTSFTVEV